MPAERNGSHSTLRILNNEIVGARRVNRGLDQNILENFADIYIRNIDAILFKEQKEQCNTQGLQNSLLEDTEYLMRLSETEWGKK